MCGEGEGGGVAWKHWEPACTYDCGTAHPPLRTRLPNQDWLPVSLFEASEGK